MEWTENRRKVATFLEKYFRDNERAPSLDEIAKGTGLWKRSVEIVLKGLEKIGYLEITPGISRGIRLASAAQAMVPLLGEVQAGIPQFSQDEAPEYLRMDRRLLSFDHPVALRVNGFSMRDAGIMPGDIVLMRMQDDAANGDTIVAAYNGGITVKTLSRKGGSICLVPANPSYKTVEVARDDEFRIVGRVMLVLRDLGGCFDFEVVTKEVGQRLLHS